MNEIDIKNEIVKALPPGAVSVTTFLGVPLADWMYAVTILYVFVQIGCLIWDRYVKARRHKNDSK